MLSPQQYRCLHNTTSVLHIQKNNSTIFRILNGDLTVFNKTLISTKDYLKALETVNATVYNKNGAFNLQGLLVNSSQSVSIFTKLNNAFKAYNGNLSKSTQLQNAYVQAVGKQNTSLGNYLAGLNGAKASIGGYIKFLVAAKAASIGLQVASVALNTAISMGITLAISTLVSQISKWIHAQEEARQKAIDLTNSYKEQRDSLNSQIEKYKELKETLDNGNLSTDETRSIKEQLLEIQKSLIESYGDEAEGIDLVNGKYREQLGLLGELSKEKADEYVKENRSAYEDAKKELEKIRTYKIGSIFSYEGRSGMSDAQKQLYDYIESYSELFEIRSMYDTSTFSNSDYAPTLFVNANADDAKLIIDQFYDDIEKYIKENNLELDYDSLQVDLSKVSSNIETDDALKEYREIYDEFIKAEVIRNDTLRPLYQQSIQAVEDYNEALSSGEGVAEAKANLDSVQQSVQNAADKSEGSQEVFDGIYDGINKSAESAYNLAQSFENDESVKGYAEQLKGLTDIDLQAINFEDNIQSPGEEAFSALIDILGLSKGEVQNLIDKLVELGYIQGEVQSETVDENSIFRAFSDTDFGTRIQHITDLFDKGTISHKEYFDALQSEINNFDASNFTNSIEDANKAATQFFVDSMQQTANGLSTLINSFDSGKISISEYLEGYLSIGNTLSSLTDSLQENSAEWNKNGDAISDSQNEALDNVQSNLESAMSTIESYQDSIYSLEQILTDSVTEGTDEFKAHINVIADDLANIVQSGGEMADEIGDVLGTTTSEIAQNLTDNVSNQEFACQAIMANTNNAITNMADAIGELFYTLGNEIANFKVDLTFSPKIASSKSINILGKEFTIPEIKFELRASGESLSNIGSAISAFGKTVASNYAPQTIDLEDFHFGNTDEGKDSNYSPSNDVTDHFNKELEKLKDSAKKSGSEAADEYLKAFEQELKELETLKDQGKITEKEFLDELRNLYQKYFKDKKKYAEQYAKYERQYLEGLKSLYDSALSGISKLMSNQIDGYNEAKEAAVSALEEERDARLEVIDVQKEQLEAEQDLIDKRIEQKQEIIDSIQKEIDAMKDARDERRRQLDLQKAQYELERMQNQRTILQYSEEEGLHYVTDTKGIREAKEKVDDAKFNIDVAKKEKEIKLIEDEIDLLEEQKEAIQVQIDALDKQTEQIENYYSNLISEQEKYFDSMIKNMEQQKSKWEELAEIQGIAEAYSAIERVVGELGYSVEDILNGNEQVFEDFKSRYIAIMSDLNQNTSFQEGLEYASGVAKENFGSIVSDARSAVQELSQTFSDGTFSQAITQGVSDGIVSAKQELDKMDQLGRDAGDGLMNGWDEKSNLFIEAAKQTAIDAVEAFAEGQDSHSPSEAYKAKAGDAIDGLLLGIEENKQSFIDTIRSLAEDGVLAFEEGFNFENSTLNTSFDGLKLLIESVTEALGLGTEGTVGGLLGALDQLSKFSFSEDSIIKQFNNLKNAVDDVVSAICGDGSSSGGERQESSSLTGSNKSKGNNSNGGNSLTAAITNIGTTANDVIGEAEAEGDGTVIGEFGSLKTTVDNVTDAIGSGGEEKSSDDESEGNLIDSIDDLGETTDDTLGKSGGDGVIGRFEEFKDVIGEANEHVTGIATGLEAINGQEVECTIKVHIERDGSPDFIGSDSEAGSMNLDSAEYTATYNKQSGYNPNQDNSVFGKLYKAWNTHYGNNNKEAEAIAKTLSHHLVMEYSQQMTREISQISNSNNIINNSKNLRQPVAVQIGDIHLTGVQDVNGLAQAIKTHLPGQMMQEYFKN